MDSGGGGPIVGGGGVDVLHPSRITSTNIIGRLLRSQTIEYCECIFLRLFMSIGQINPK